MRLILNETYFDDTHFDKTHFDENHYDENLFDKTHFDEILSLVTCHLSLVNHSIVLLDSQGIQNPMTRWVIKAKQLFGPLHLTLVVSHLSFVTFHFSPVTCHLQPVTCHFTLVTCHFSLVTYHLSLVTYHLLITLLYSWSHKEYKNVKLVGYSSLICVVRLIGTLLVSPKCIVPPLYCPIPSSS